MTTAETRHKCVVVFKDLLCPIGASEATEIKAAAIAMELERQIFVNTAPADYMDRIVSIRCNMTADAAADLISTFELDTLSLEDVYRFRCVNGSLLYETSGVEKFHDACEAKVLWSQQHQQAADNEDLIDLIIKDDTAADSTNRSSIRCAKCLTYDIEIDCKQTRSADEPMTLFCVCLNPDCRATWRGRS